MVVVGISDVVVIDHRCGSVGRRCCHGGIIGVAIVVATADGVSVVSARVLVNVVGVGVIGVVGVAVGLMIMGL